MCKERDGGEEYWVQQLLKIMNTYAVHLQEIKNNGNCIQLFSFCE
jgi:hypothetical protein